MNRSLQVKKMPDPKSRMMAREKFPRTGMELYQEKLAGKSQNKSEIVWILEQT